MLILDVTDYVGQSGFITHLARECDRLISGVPDEIHVTPEQERMIHMLASSDSIRPEMYRGVPLVVIHD